MYLLKREREGERERNIDGLPLMRHDQGRNPQPFGVRDDTLQPTEPPNQGPLPYFKRGVIVSSCVACSASPVRPEAQPGIRSLIDSVGIVVVCSRWSSGSGARSSPHQVCGNDDPSFSPRGDSGERLTLTLEGKQARPRDPPCRRGLLGRDGEVGQVGVQASSPGCNCLGEPRVPPRTSNPTPVLHIPP